MTNILIDLAVQNGEYRYSCKSVHQTKASPEFAAQRHASKFYGNGSSSRDGEWWNFNGGEVAVKVDRVHLLTNEEYQVLSKYLP